jgi:putative flippase GtrA
MILDARSRPDAGERSHRPTADPTGHRWPHSVGGPAASLGMQVGTFVVIGIASTLAYVVLYGGLRGVFSSVASNAVALFVTAIANTAANRRLTFGVRHRASMLRDQAAGLGAFAIALAITTLAAGALAILAPGADRTVEVAVLVAANVLATAVRFVLLRAVIAPGRSGPRVIATDRVDGISS